MVLFFGQCRGPVNSRKGARRKGLFARPAPHATAGTLPGGLQGADACVNEGIWLWGGSGTKSPGGPGSYREASASLGRGAEHDGIVGQGCLLWQEGWWHHLGGGVRTAGWRGWFLREPRDWVVGRQRNQIARGAGLLQKSIRRPGQRRCRSPALRAIGQGRWVPQLRGNVRRGCLVYRRVGGANWAPLTGERVAGG